MVNKRQYVLLLSTYPSILNTEQGHTHTASWFKFMGNNTGNDLFAYSTYCSLIEHNTIDISTFHDFQKMPLEKIHKYDCIIILAANMISFFWDSIPLFTDKLLQIKIPIHCIGIGVQSPDFSVENCIKSIKTAKKSIQKLKQYLHHIDKNGTFSVRGLFTYKVLKEYFQLSNIYITGCPSMFLRGYSLPKIPEKKVAYKNFTYAINGLLFLRNNNFRNENSYFVCQDDLYYLNTKKGLIEERFYHYFIDPNNPFLELYSDNRMKIFYGTQAWKNFFIEKQIHFSFGTRIHGNILPVLVGIPAQIAYIDSRTREMAELFHIPSIDAYSLNPNKIDIYEYYQQIKFDNFYDTYFLQIEKFKDYLKVIGIQNSIGEDLLPN